MEKALLVIIKHEKEDKNWEAESLGAELRELARSSGVFIAGELIARRSDFTAKYLIGEGKIRQIADKSRALGCQVVIFNHDLNGTQQRNLEDVLDTKTIDRTQLILDIFAQRAHSKEGKIQVELAQLIYLLPRLTGKGIILSRLGGGIGTRGPGEKKLEADRRKIREKIVRLKKELDLATAQREARRKNRRRFDTPSVALVGYTNAGKSTLFNAFTASGAYVKDKLFSTLDPTVRKYTLPNNQTIVFSDTVGFIHNLPHHLIESFKATLEEAVHADILLHVVDMSHPRIEECRVAVEGVLSDLGLEGKSVVNVLNKRDLLSDEMLASGITGRFDSPVVISALRKAGLDALNERLMQELSSLMTYISVELHQTDMKRLNIIYTYGNVLKKEYRGNKVYIEAAIPERFRGLL